MSSTTPELLEVLDVPRRGQTVELIVRAGAGAGKTTELVRRVLALAKNQKQLKGDYPKLIVTTFTRKATQELRERLLTESIKLQDPELVNYISKSAALHISTIHGVLHKFLSHFGGAIGLAPVFQFISSRDEIILIKKILRAEARTNSEFAEAYRSLTESFEWPQFLSALRIAIDLKFAGEKFEFIQIDELIQRRDQEATAAEKTACSLLQSLEVASGLSEKWIEYKNLLQDTLASTEATRWSLFDEQKPAVRVTKAFDPEIGELKKLLQEQVEDLIAWRNSDEYFQLHQGNCEKFLSVCNLVFERLLKSKVETGQLTINDLENLSLKIVRENPESAKQFSSMWDYWLVDEYQDTSPRQVELIAALKGDRHSFTVGDPQQSIYLFRGARSEVFIEKENQIKAQAFGQQEFLLTNYRSSPQLLEYFNFVFTNISTQFSSMQAGRPSESDDRPVALYLQPKEDFESKEAKELWETRACLARAQELVQQKVPLEQICILTRTNRELEALSAEARQLGLPFQVHASDQFIDRREIRDALSLLRFLVNSSDNRNLIELLRAPYLRVSDAELIRLGDRAQYSYWQKALTLWGSQPGPVQTLKELLQKAQDRGIGVTWKQALQDLGFFDVSTRLDPSGRREANLWKLVATLTMAERQSGFNYLQWLEDNTDVAIDLDGSGDSDAISVLEPKRIQLMTVHASKGLQFQHVILPGMGRYRSRVAFSVFNCDKITGRWSLSVLQPDDAKWATSSFARAWQDEQKLRERQEYDRVLYVALTRAKSSVTLIWSKPDSGSWAERIWRPSLEGVQKYDFGLAEMRVGDFAPAKAPFHLQGGSAVKPKWATTLPSARSTVSVTELVSKKDAGRFQSTENTLEASARIARGILAHHFFEMLKYQTQPKFSDPQMASSYQFLKKWQSGVLLRLIHEGEVEWGFCVDQDGSRIQGQLDLWGVADGVLWVVDYKTGSTRYKEKAFEQMRIYLQALKQVRPELKDRPAKLAAVYPFDEKVFVQDIKVDAQQSLF